MGTNSIYGAAATSQGAIATTKVATQLQGKNQIRVSFKAGNVAQNDVMIKPGGFRTAAEIATNIDKVAFEGKNWDSFAQFIAYFNTHGTQIEMIRMETDNVDNYDGELTIQRKSPTGKVIELPISLSPYKTESAKNTGFSNTLIIPSSELSFVLSAFTEVIISRIHANSTIHFYFDISGETKSLDLAGINSEIL